MADTVHGGFLKSVPWNKWGEKSTFGMPTNLFGGETPI